MAELASDLIVGTVFGQGAYGMECEVCRQTDWGRGGGQIDHLEGCEIATATVKLVREGKMVRSLRGSLALLLTK